MKARKKPKIKKFKFFTVIDYIGINHSNWLKLLNPICRNLPCKIPFPLTIIFKITEEMEKSVEPAYQETFYVNDRVEVLLLGNESPREIDWTVAHEFRHHWQHHDPLLYKFIYNGDRRFLIKVMEEKTGEKYTPSRTPTYYDLLPEEQDANNFAHMITGTYFKFLHYLDKKRVRPRKNYVMYKRRKRKKR